mmetsp:Transcript_12716/g.26285  ORF Transcript_12716/g.26285 Transcript_12716/m.26285 type:complete len:300 (-) Transcript_12716:335-1234(-)
MEVLHQTAPTELQMNHHRMPPRHRYRQLRPPKKSPRRSSPLYRSYPRGSSHCRCHPNRRDPMRRSDRPHLLRLQLRTMVVPVPSLLLLPSLQSSIPLVAPHWIVGLTMKPPTAEQQLGGQRHSHCTQCPLLPSLALHRRHRPLQSLPLQSFPAPQRRYLPLLRRRFQDQSRPHQYSHHLRRRRHHPPRPTSPSAPIYHQPTSCWPIPARSGWPRHRQTLTRQPKPPRCVCVLLLRQQQQQQRTTTDRTPRQQHQSQQPRRHRHRHRRYRWRNRTPPPRGAPRPALRHRRRCRLDSRAGC